MSTMFNNSFKAVGSDNGFVIGGVCCDVEDVVYVFGPVGMVAMYVLCPVGVADV